MFMKLVGIDKYNIHRPESEKVSWNMRKNKDQSENDLHRYDDIINLPHHVSSVHLPMPAQDRAAQFAPFAALTGYGAAIRETARLTGERIELDENCKMAIDRKLQMIKEQIASNPIIVVTYFKPDMKKQGGTYVTVQGRVKKIDEYVYTLVMMNGEKIPLRDIIDIEGEMFRTVETY